MKAFPAIVILIILALSVLLVACTGTEPVTDPHLAEMEAVAKDLTTSIDAGLADIRAGNGNVSNALSTTNLSGVGAEAVLWKPHALLVGTLVVVISPKGIVLPRCLKIMPIVGRPDDHAFFQEANAFWAPMVSEVFRWQKRLTQRTEPSGLPLAASRYTDITYDPYTFPNRHVENTGHT
jgi:hypothetical protein